MYVLKANVLTKMVLKKTIRIDKTGTVCEIDINPTEKDYSKYFRHKGVRTCKKLHMWKLSNSCSIHLYGYTSGRERQINKEELPPPVDTKLFFGDLLLLKFNNNILQHFTKKDYKAFWNAQFGGVENLDDFSSEEDEEDDYDYDDPFIVDDR